ncbi:MAG: 16S rRNA (uracil(1498)-N(3))-methyltransferase [Planctomycetaceae bacterium]|nr:16S rRNA (uracil(1498)-N(3))-methyltransferase [Planctomycetales bacterium]MCB9921607.1 16S rRNA (uracil(1498)-N(3))-methyltransferase [Planctomycetaceae bacterium]
MSRRYFADSPITGQNARLTGQEAQHLSKVMRAQIGDDLIVFDGGGAEFAARVERVSRSEVELSIMERYEIDRELSFRLSFGVALPKGDRQRWLVEKLVELGVSQLVPLVTSRSVAQPCGNAIERLRRAVVEASKQCGRNRLMAIGDPCSFDAFLAEASGTRVRLLAHPATTSETMLRANSPGEDEDVAVIIGPEGGFTDEEVARSQEHEWRTISLGPRVLRTETAAVAIAAVFAVPSSVSR